MKDKSKRTLAPKLRFPEFRNAPAWAERPLGEVLTPIVREREKPTVSYTGLGVRSHGKGTFLKELVQPEKNSMEYLYEVEGDDLIVNITFAWEGAIAIAKATDAGSLVSHRFPTYMFERDAAIPEFFRYLIVDKRFIYNLGVISPGGAGRNRVLNKKDFLKLGMAMPDAAEQQKIADCLSSLDELIAAEGRKLEALRAQKKGLMKQLFPRPGETRPRLRFPEFRNAPDWENVSLGSICQIQRGKFSHRPRNDPKYFNGPYPFLQTGDVVRADGGAVSASQSLNELGLSVSKLFKPTIVLITIAANIGDTAILESEACFTDSVVGLIPKDDRVTPRFLELVVRLKKEFLNKIAAQAAQKNINNEILGALTLLVPSMDEQLKIEDCISALDVQIAAQSQKLEALKTHKEGLMQQLSPSPEEDL